MTRLYQTAAAFVAFNLLVTAPAFAQQFDDKNFPDAAWSSNVSLPISPNPPGNPSFTAARQTTGGNPGGYRSTHIVFDGSSQGTAMMAIAHLRQGFQYHPGKKGPLDQISFAYDLGGYAGSKDYADDASCFGFAFLIHQKGVYYRSKQFDYACRLNAWNPSIPGAVQNTSWYSFPKKDLKAADFVQVHPAGNGVPDLTCGRPIRFGYMSAASTKGDQTIKIDKTGGVDNLRIALTKAADVTTPCGCALRAKTTTSTPSVAKGQQISLKIEVDNVGKKECETARIINYWISGSPIGPAFVPYTQFMADVDKTWLYTTSGFPIGNPIPGAPIGTFPSVPKGDIYRTPNAPLTPGAPPLVWTGANIGPAANSALNCTMTVVAIGEYEDLRNELYVAVNDMNLKGPNFVTWANNLNAHLHNKGTTEISCAGIDVT